jgi:drug/metabolite transporter (DMT)-like permease
MIAALAWGSAPAANRAILLKGVSPFTIFPLKQVIGAVVMIGALALIRRLPRMDWNTFKAGVVIGVFNMTIPTVLFTLGFQIIPASIGSVIVGVIPLTTILFTHWVVPGERFRVERLPGLLVALLGVSAMGWAPIGQTSSTWILGVGVTTLGAVCSGLGGAFTRRYAVRYSNRQLIVSQFLTSAVLLSLISVPYDGYRGYLTIDSTSLWLIIYLGAGTTVVSFAAFMWASRIATAARVALIGYLVPVLGAVAGVLLLSEPVTIQLILGMVAVSIGMIVSDRPDRLDDRRRAAAR